ncbi:MAG: class A beta-lactamase-related serine hydrolase [Bacteroidota bacterium]|nr:class A beta-lactamase-related serine hydrolase [Bacteroidota bacterium]
MKKIFLIALAGFFISSSLYAQSAADSLLNFILKNKTRASLYLQKNDYVIAKLNEDKLMPLASTVKIIVAVEFAKQAAYNVFSFNAAIPIKDVNKYYLPNTDGGAHPDWIRYETRMGHIKNDSVKLIDVARGMIMFNSDANEEYLMELLGFNNIKNDLHMFGLKQHTLIYPIPASLFVYQNPKNLPEDKVLKEIQGLSEEDYYKAIFSIHRELNLDENYKSNFRPKDLTLTMQKAWSDRLPASTVKEYARVCRILNSRLILNERTYSILSKILETAMETPSTKTWLHHIGIKGGNTISVFTRALYATLKDSSKIELVYFFNDLNGQENYKLQSWMIDFEAKILKDDKFRNKLTNGIEGKVEVKKK